MGYRDRISKAQELRRSRGSQEVPPKFLFALLLTQLLSPYTVVLLECFLSEGAIEAGRIVVAG